VCNNFPRQFHFFLGAIHEKHNFKYFKNPTVKFGEMMSINYCIYFFLIFRSVGEGKVWGWLYLIYSLQKTATRPPVLFNFVGQHHTSWIFYTSINNSGYFQGIYALCDQILHLFQLQMKCQIFTCINSLKITYIPIILLLTVLQLYSFDFGYSLVVLGKDFFSGGWGGEGGSDITGFFQKHNFPFLYYHNINIQ
jgi:hypothetical protein